ncbi:unnamed protein product [marine sediment metagenome]|uniref:Uncharacterized protein n=1 Tax=marine sediment metagenome TaxID=412755 RepID=X1TQV1_9ZZZZ
MRDCIANTTPMEIETRGETEMMEKCKKRGHHAFNLDNSNVIANDYYEETIKIVCAMAKAVVSAMP